MKLSVCITTYNHAPYIEQALEGVLSQQVCFDYEILIGEDDSSDGTRQIVKHYALTFPERIRLFLHERKNVLYIDGRPTGHRNFVNNIKHAQGEYIALLDGDDYWTDPLKLQKQVDFLDTYPKTAICFHAVKCVNEGEQNLNIIQRPRGMCQFYSLQDLLSENIVPSCSAMFRQGLFEDFPDWYYRISVGDWPLHVLNAQHGNLGYINDVMAVYRIHSGGYWMGRPLAKRLEGIITNCQVVANHLSDADRNILNKMVFGVSMQLAKEYLKLGERGRAQALLKLDGAIPAMKYGYFSDYVRLFWAAYGLVRVGKAV